jgi:hypothetical protein
MVEQMNDREWEGLTEEEIVALDLSNYVQVVKIVEDKLKEKNYENED